MTVYISLQQNTLEIIISHMIGMLKIEVVTITLS